MVDELLEEIQRNGWLFNNCYQITDGDWRVNLRRPAGDGDWFTDWAVAPTFVEALELCIVKMEQAEFVDGQEQIYSIDLRKMGLLEQLGMMKPKKPIVRRV